MDHIPATTNTIYAEIPWEQGASARCSQCGATLPAEHLIWMKLPTLHGHLALCGPCYGDTAVGVMDAVRRPAVAATP